MLKVSYLEETMILEALNYVRGQISTSYIAIFEHVNAGCYDTYDKAERITALEDLDGLIKKIEEQHNN